MIEEKNKQVIQNFASSHGINYEEAQKAFYAIGKAFRNVMSAFVERWNTIKPYFIELATVHSKYEKEQNKRFYKKKKTQKKNWKKWKKRK